MCYPGSKEQECIPVPPIARHVDEDSEHKLRREPCRSDDPLFPFLHKRHPPDVTRDAIVSNPEAEAKASAEEHAGSEAVSQLVDEAGCNKQERK